MPVQPTRTTAPPAGGPAPSGEAERALALRRMKVIATSVLVVLAASMMGLAVVEQQHCRNQGWDTPDAFWHACYSDIPISFMNGLRADPEPSLSKVLADGTVDAPPLAAAAMWTVARLTPLSDDADVNPRRYFDASALFLGRLKGVTSPEKKRKIIGHTFIEVFDREAR